MSLTNELSNLTITDKLNMPNGVIITGIQNNSANNTLVYNPSSSEIYYTNNDNKLPELNLSTISLSFTNLYYEKKYQIPYSGLWWNLSMSQDSKYQLACQNTLSGQVFTSSDYGITWIPVILDELGLFYGGSISYSGQYQTVVRNTGKIYLSSDYGITWTSKKIINNWFDVAVSGDGKYQTAVSFDDNLQTGGYIFTSNNFGKSWIDATPKFLVPGFYYYIYLSQDGKYQTATITANNTADGNYYTSSLVLSNDYGKTWTVQTFGTNLIQNSMSNDGKYQIAVDFNPGIWTSSDYGNTWIFIANQSDWYSSDISSTGQYQICVSRTNIIYRSSDYGNTWNSTTFPYPITSVAMSGDGEKITICYNYGKIYNSINNGDIWTDNNNSPIFNSFQRPAISSGGKYQSVPVTNNQIYISSNYGDSWKKVETIQVWRAIGMSATGQYQTAVVSFGNIYTSSDYGNTWIEYPLNRKNLINSISMSATGQYQMCAEDPGSIIVSYDFGITWNIIPVVFGYFNCCAVSASGQFMTCCDGLGSTFSGGQIYISEDYGRTFIGLPSTDFHYWNNIQMCANGKYRLAVTYYGNYWTSVDYGKTWTIGTTNIKGNINLCAVSATGQYQMLNVTFPIYGSWYSEDWGASWDLLTIPSEFNNEKYDFSTLSSSGQYLILYSQNILITAFVNPRLRIA
jgi:photosystem II stability/assembly factor-like uncharacterized protein